MIRQALVIVLLLALVSCGWNHVCTKTRSYNLGEEKIVAVGSEMVQDGCFATRWDPTGLNKILWKRDPQNEYVALVDKELLYSGREGDVLHISYREFFRFLDYRNGVVSEKSGARTPFFQQVYYDLKTSDMVVFQDWVLQVLDANNQRIRFKVVQEPPRSTGLLLPDR